MSRPSRFDAFTERARQSLSYAQEEAQHFKQDYIDTQHLLLGLIDIGNGAAIQLLRQLDIDPQRVREAVVAIIECDYDSVQVQIGLTDRAKSAIQLAVEESHRLHHGNIGTEHLLLGLIREGEGIAGTVLATMGVTLERARQATSELAGYPQGEPRVGTASARYGLNSRLTPEQTRTLFERAFAHRTLDEMRQTAAHYHLCVTIIDELLATREAVGDAPVVPPAQQEDTRTVPPTHDTRIFGHSEISQKTPEQMRATVQHLLIAKTPAELRQIIQTTRQHTDMLEHMLNEQAERPETSDGDEHDYG